MNLQPAHWSTGAMKPWVAGADRGSIWLPLEVISPSSAVGRKAHLYLSEDDLTALLKELRHIAAYQRSHPEVLEAESWEGPVPALGGAADDYA